MVDDPGRENEGDFVMAAELVTPERVNFMVTHGRGIVCMPITSERAHELGVPLLPRSPADNQGCAFTVSIDLLDPPNTGTSAFDRAHCMARAAEPDATAAEFRRPGHVFPVIARPGGVLERAGHTEAAVDLARMAGLQPTGVICEVMNPDGAMARLDDLRRIAAGHGLHLVTIADLIAYRARHESLVRRGPEASIPTPHGSFTAIGFHSQADGLDHVALAFGEITADDVLVRIHDECAMGDVFGQLGCDCGTQLDAAMRSIALHGRGVVVYLRAPHDATLGCRAGEGSPDTAVQILRELGIGTARILNDDRTRFALEARGIRVTTPATGENITELSAAAG